MAGILKMWRRVPGADILREMQAIEALKLDRRRITYILALAALASCYVAAARFGLRLNAVAGFATLVWAPSGIALGALLRFGTRLWPGVWIGALITNILTGAHWPVALGMATGNTIEAVAGTYLLCSLPDFDLALDRVTDVLALIALAALLSTTLSATVGVASLRLGGVVAPTAVGETWRAWWLGDVIGEIVVAPVLLVWWTFRPVRVSPERLLESAALAAAVVATGLFIFSNVQGHSTPFGEAYLVFPVLLWATLRFGQRGAATAVFIISFVAVWGTALGHGPFARPLLFSSLLTLQVFMGVTAITFLVLGALVAERSAATRALELGVTEQKMLHDAAVEANQAKSKFLAVMSHELRTPLNAIRGYADLLTLEAKGPLTTTQRDYVERIQRNEEHLLRLIDQVLNFAKIEAGQVTLDLEDVLVHDALAAVQASVEPQIAQYGLRFELTSVDTSLTVRADRGRLHQILLNLATNAMKFTDAGGVITVGARPHVGVEGDSTDARVAIWVRDTGIGMAADQLHHALEPFVQLEHPSAARRSSGVGLGLAIAHDLAKAMNGDLLLSSEVGQGTTATLVLPGR